VLKAVNRCRKSGLAVNTTGNIALYLLLIIPLALTLGLITIDILRWHSLGSNLQLKADRLTLDAARLLPDREAARALVEDALESSGYIQANNEYQLDVTGHQVSLTLGSKLDSPTLVPGSAQSDLFKQRRYSRAEISAVDLVIVASDGESLRPAALSYWEETAGGEYSVTQCNSQNSVFADCQNRWQIQNCFNPSYLELKSNLSWLISEVQKTEVSSTSLLFSPGDNPSSGFSIFQFENEQSVLPNYLYSQPRNSLSDSNCREFASSIELPEIPPVPGHLALLNRVSREIPASNQLPELGIAIEAAVCQFPGLCNERVENTQMKKNTVKERLLLVVSDTLNLPAGKLVEAISFLESVGIKPVFVAWAHPGLKPQQREELFKKINIVREQNPESGFLAQSSSGLRDIFRETVFGEFREVRVGR